AIPRGPLRALAPRVALVSRAGPARVPVLGPCLDGNARSGRGRRHPHGHDAEGRRRIRRASRDGDRRGRRRLRTRAGPPAARGEDSPAAGLDVLSATQPRDTELAREVERRLASGGEVSRSWPHYAPRPGQIALARDVARAVERGGVLLAEAPTGVGKSLAYLLPGVLHAAETGRRVVIATCTRSLQDQLFERDLPALLGVLGLELPCARLKGKQNYVCEPTLGLVEE